MEVSIVAKHIKIQVISTTRIPIVEFVTTEEKKRQGTKLSNKTLLQRRKDRGFIVPYKVTDNPHLLASSDWDRVLAVFPTGPTRHWPGLFGMPCDRNPAKLFSKNETEESWDVSAIKLSGTKRHLDRGAIMVFWALINEFFTTEEKKRQGTKLSNKTLLQRRKDGGFIVPYKVTDNPHLLASSDWDRVVAVFATGPTLHWHSLFGMPCDRNPAKLFSKSKTNLTFEKDLFT
ncbi:accessory factor associated with RNA polymerase II [Homalodisca vitripennis]|nr:accessory factor associated with RNA polymerase II [Homalodisca vitripennis]